MRSGMSNNLRLETMRNPPQQVLKALRRKIDWHIVPIMFCCYAMQLIDKVLLNVSHLVTRCPVAIIDE